MACRYFNPLAQYIRFSYRCPNCGEINTLKKLDVPSPNWLAESNADSVESEYYTEQCEQCGEEHIITISNSFYDGLIIMEDVEDSEIFDIEESLPEAEFSYDKELFDITHDEISELLDAVDGLPETVRDKFYRMLYANVITSMETYLGDTIKHYVLDSDEYLRKFVENYHPYQEQQIKMSDIYREQEKLKSRIRKSLNELLYHNLGKICPIYKQLFDIDFGNITELCKAVQTRHDLVHRNGKDLEGNIHKITKDDVQKLAQSVNDFIYNIESNLPAFPGTGITESVM